VEVDDGVYTRYAGGSSLTPLTAPGNFINNGSVISFGAVDNVGNPGYNNKKYVLTIKDSSNFTVYSNSNQQTESFIFDAVFTPVHNTTYTVSVYAVGDGTTYSNSPATTVQVAYKEYLYGYDVTSFTSIVPESILKSKIDPTCTYPLTGYQPSSGTVTYGNVGANMGIRDGLYNAPLGMDFRSSPMWGSIRFKLLSMSSIIDVNYTTYAFLNVEEVSPGLTLRVDIYFDEDDFNPSNYNNVAPTPSINNTITAIGNRSIDLRDYIVWANGFNEHITLALTVTNAVTGGMNAFSDRHISFNEVKLAAIKLTAN